jgi:hypothetical protein
MTILLVIGVLLFGFVVSGPIRKQIRFGYHLTKLTNIFEAIERTRGTMPIGSGGGFDSLPINDQRNAEMQIKNSIAYLKGFPRHQVTAELLKNLRLADRMGRGERSNAIGRLLKFLVGEDVALELDLFAASYS